jgi:DNA processing protein
MPEEAYATGLALLPMLGPAALRRILASDRPSRAWARVVAEMGRADGAARAMTAARSGRTTPVPEGRGPELIVPDLADVWRRHCEHRIAVLLADHPNYPSRLRADPGAPAVLFCLGRPECLDGVPTVAIVGTRAPTRYGIGVAAQLGAELAAAGVSVVSGLALGVDAAAHEGACGAGAPPIAVVAGGLDEPYPRSHARLWDRIAEHGVIVSQSPAGTKTERWRFPTRNRLLAALSDVVVVVECRHHGGSRHTVDAALDRGIPVGAVPGSIRSQTSEGPNALIADGAFPVCSTSDILLALSMNGAPTAPSTRPRAPVETATGAAREGVDRVVYDALTADPAPLDTLVRSTGLGLSELCGSLERLAQAGLAADAGGWWART